MPSLFNAARSLLRALTSFPLSRIIGFIPCSISFNAANNPAGPAPIMITFFCAPETSLNSNF